MPRTKTQSKRIKPDSSRDQRTEYRRGKQTHDAQSFATSAPLSSELSVAQLAHELNSLLDGSMRCVGLARRTLRQGPTNSNADVDAGLSKAHAAMCHMAALLERAMKVGDGSPRSTASAMFRADQTLVQTLAELTGLLTPHATQANAAIQTSLEPSVESVPVGPLGSVLLNGLRNALQACESTASNVPQTIQVTASQHEADLSITIASPIANKPAGHRIGMALSEQIIREIGGEIARVSTDSKHTLRISVPLTSLMSHA